MAEPVQNPNQINLDELIKEVNLITRPSKTPGKPNWSAIQLVLEDNDVLGAGYTIMFFPERAELAVLKQMASVL